MGQDESGADPLLKAIGEFRQELMHWIDSRIGSLHEHEAGLESASSTESPPPRSILKEPAEAVPAGDARHRLDTLARQLNDRLRGADGTRAGADRAGRAEENRTPTR
jgi:hypothetical protein